MEEPAVLSSEGRSRLNVRHITPSLTVDLLVVDLPGDNTQRIRALPSHTILHVPASCRLRMISAVAQCWKGMAQGRDDNA